MTKMKCMLVVLLLQVGVVEAGCKWWDAPCKARRTARRAADAAKRAAEAAAREARRAAEAAAREAKRAAEAAAREAARIAQDLAARTSCLAGAGINASVAIAQSLVGKAISFEEISTEGALGAANLSVRVKGKVALKPFNIATSVGRNGFTQDGFKQLLYDPLAKLF